MCRFQATHQRVTVDVVGEEPLAVELDDRKPLAVARLQVGIAADVDLDQLERMLGANLLEHLASPLTEVAAGGSEERDPSYG